MSSWIICHDPVQKTMFEKLLFGGTLDEIAHTAFAYHCAIRGTVPKKDREKFVRVGLSKKQDNQCAYSAAFIPKGFPYLIWDDTTTGPYGRISLSAFYHHLAFQCRSLDKGGKPDRTPMFARLVEAGAEPEVLTRFCEIGHTQSKRALIHWTSVPWPGA